MNINAGNGKIDKEEFLAAMTQWLQHAAEARVVAAGAKRVIGSPTTTVSRKKAAASVSMVSELATVDRH